ncbi:hypothetical protein BABINDRAFT_7462 [Babjeviella inositovora NRRL Y-12698]|uniref:candidapepsin n=1 Tax=Babjeviella inositovora NRRL Y-12698 TaxID=984486 RepID=A0A1E3QUZ7_9ASCO|nr:uncharacterized protein BABINDRAFT_7462 [Babjeviella inositovora NRRL Y-12698]ODQ80767.1 hypothetical protein BABINDRAFT_7462 [Babjeviella inositovora NRRL Y-12698]
MKLLNPLLLSIFSIISSASGAPTSVKRGNDQQGVVKVDFNVHRGSSVGTAQLGAQAKRNFKRNTDGTAAIVLENEQSFYMANMTIGSNHQMVGVLLDTGSSDLWVNGRDNIYCSKTSTTGDSTVSKLLETRDTTSIDCSLYGTFDTSMSTSYKSNGSDFAIYYADNTFAKGEWGHDDVTFGSVLVNDLSFAVADEATSEVGVLGIGLPGLETTKTQYENLPMKMRSAGLIHSSVYSIYLGSNAEKGTILFGGVDTSKYQGLLKTVPMVDVASNRIQVEMNDMTYNGMSFFNHQFYPALLDSGSTLSLFPQAVIDLIVSVIDLQYYEELASYIGSCSMIESSNFTFNFGGARIDVPMFNFFFEHMVVNDDGVSRTCVLNVGVSDNVTLGDSFLRGVYTVFDMEKYELSLATATFGDDTENIQPYVDSVPGAILMSKMTLVQICLMWLQGVYL